MKELTESRIAVLPREPLFELLLDVERYPEFVPGYRLAHVLDRGVDWMRVTQEVGIGRLQSRFDSAVRFAHPEWIEIRTENGPFKQMSTFWELEYLERWRTRVHLKIIYEIRSSSGALLARPWFNQWRRRVLDAFLRRAAQVAA